MEWLIYIDEKILLAINGAHCAFMDHVMWAFSDRFFWIPLYLFLAWLLFRKKGTKTGILSLVVIAGMIAVTDQTCSSLIRPLVERLRPSSLENPISTMIHLVNGHRCGQYGFPSSHAANTFALALFLGMLFRNRKYTIAFLSWAFIISYSRIYMGVHYPGDIVAGALIGISYAILFHKLFIFAQERVSIFNPSLG